MFRELAENFEPMRNNKLAARVVSQYTRTRPRLAQRLNYREEEDLNVDTEDTDVQELVSPDKATQAGKKLVVDSVYTDVRKALGIKGSALFKMYRDFHGMQLGMPIPTTLVADFRQAVRFLLNVKARTDGRKLSPPVQAQLLKAAKKIAEKLQKIADARNPDVRPRIHWKRVAEEMGPLLVSVAVDKGVFIKESGKTTVGGVAWSRLFKMKPREAELTQLEDDPQTREALLRYGLTLKQSLKKAEASITADGLVPQAKRYGGRVLTVGIHPGDKDVVERVNKLAILKDRALQNANGIWKNWLKKSLDVPAEQYQDWLALNPEPPIASQADIDKRHVYWERREPKGEDAIPESTKAWKDAEPTLEGMRENATKAYKLWKEEKEIASVIVEEIVYDIDGSRLPFEEYKEKQAILQEDMKQLTSEHLIGDARIGFLKLFTEEYMQGMPGPAKPISLTDDDAKKHSLTRVFEMKEVPISEINKLIDARTATMVPPVPEHLWGSYRLHDEGRSTTQVVTSGRYAGIPVDHLVNENGRMIERTEYIFDIQTGESHGRPKRDVTGWEQSEREPFVTMTGDGKLLLTMSGGKKWRKQADALKSIAGEVRKPDGTWLPPSKKRALVDEKGFYRDRSFDAGKAGLAKGRKGNQLGFVFTPDNFGLVQEKIGSFALSEGASKALEKHFEDLTRGVVATKIENLEPYSAENLGEFRRWALNDTGEDWENQLRDLEKNLEKFGRNDPDAPVWEAGIKELQRRLARPEFLLRRLDELQDLLEDFPDQFVEERKAEIEAIHEIFRTEELGGFKFELLELQKKSLAWMDARGDSGVCALDTGLGKTIIALSMVQKLTRDGTEEDILEVLNSTGTSEEEVAAREEMQKKYPNGTNGRFLYVAPSKNLLGNLDKEAKSFLTEKGYKISGPKIDSIMATGPGSFQSGLNRKKDAELSLAVQRGGASGKVKIENWPLEVTRYVAIIFDEAHEYMTKTKGASGKAFLGLRHPRKIVLTASPMAKEPMDAYLLASVVNNNDLSDTKSPEGRKRRRDMTAWKDRYCEVIGGRVVGAKRGEPSIERDLKAWSRQNLFFADKQSVVEKRARPPKLVSDRNNPGGGTKVVMRPEVENAAREISKGVKTELEALYTTFQNRGYLPETQTVTDPATGEEHQIVVPRGKKRDYAVPKQSFINENSFKLKPLITLLKSMSLCPELATLPKINAGLSPAARKKIEGIFGTLFPGVKEGEKLFPNLSIEDNPKFQQSQRIVQGKTGADESNTKKVLLWTDDPRMVVETAKSMSKTQGGIHVAALKDLIIFFQGGSEMPEFTYPGGGPKDRMKLPFKKKLYRLFPSRPIHIKNNPGLSEGDEYLWSQFVTKNFVQGSREVKSMTCLGTEYQSGQNFQKFQTVVHLDRDGGSSENMKQRTARAYRQGQKNTVEEITLDAQYTDPPKPGDASMDELRRLQQVMEGDIFDSIVKESQDHPVGKEWEMIDKKLSKYTHLDKKALELLVAPGSQGS